MQDDYNGHLNVCLDSQDHLVEVQHHRHQGVGQEQGLPQRVKFWKKCINKGCSKLLRMIIMAISRTSPRSDFLEKLH